MHCEGSWQKEFVQILVNDLLNEQLKEFFFFLLPSGRTSCTLLNKRRHTQRKIYQKGVF